MDILFSTNLAAFSINRNIVECKDQIHEASRSLIRVLIETLWNVKQRRKRRRPADDETSINRNIVECKDFHHSRVFQNPSVLIETLWNVKIINGVKNLFGIRINRNIVECKGWRKTVFSN